MAFIRKNKVSGNEYIQVVEYYQKEGEEKRRLKILRGFERHTFSSGLDAKVYLAVYNTVVDFTKEYNHINQQELFQRIMKLNDGYVAALLGYNGLKWILPKGD